MKSDQAEERASLQRARLTVRTKQKPSFFQSLSAEAFAEEGMKTILLGLTRASTLGSSLPLREPAKGEIIICTLVLWV